MWLRSYPLALFRKLPEAREITRLPAFTDARVSTTNLLAFNHLHCGQLCATKERVLRLLTQFAVLGAPLA